MKNRKPIFKKIRLEFTEDDLYIIVANNFKQGFKLAKSENKGLKGFEFPKEHKNCPALCWPSKAGVVLFFIYPNIKASYICHEVSHATHSLLQSIGLRLNEETDEVYAYHNDMLFRMCVNFMKENKLKIKL